MTAGTVEYTPLGDSGVVASTICLGTWAIGGWMWGGTADVDEVIRRNIPAPVGPEFMAPPPRKADFG